MNGLDRLKNAIVTLPQTPGVYRMIGKNGNVLYVGKAKNIKKRVTSYTKTDTLSNRILMMVMSIDHVEITETASEAEAFILENDLIKTFDPPFNILLRDDKSFPFIAFTKGAFPRVYKKRGKLANEELFGPFADVGAVDQMITVMEKIFLLRTCKDAVFSNRTRPCILYQIKRCSGPCCGLVSKEEYSTLVKEARNFLKGKSDHLQNSLIEKMNAASAAQDYLLAAVYRDRLKALNAILHQTFTDIKTLPDTDVFGLFQENGFSAMEVTFVRGGKNAGSVSFFFEDISEDILDSFIGQFYQKYPLPKEILTSIPVPDFLSDILKVPVRHRVIGARDSLVNRSVQNAKIALQRHLINTQKESIGLHDLSTLLGVDVKIIEAYDNSHLFGTHPVGICVQAGPEGFIKNGYRKFNIKTDAGSRGDDFGMMKEVLNRRFTHQPFPDVILIDGGRGQLSAIADIIPPDVTVIGIAKGERRNDGKETFYHLKDDRTFRVLDIPENTPLRFYLQRLRDESHRFAVGSHRAKRKKGMFTSKLEEVSGLGPKKRAALLQHFGSVPAIKNATLLELLKVKGINEVLAHKIIETL